MNMYAQKDVIRKIEGFYRPPRHRQDIPKAFYSAQREAVALLQQELDHLKQMTPEEFLRSRDSV